ANPTSVGVGTPVLITAMGFYPNYAVTISFTGPTQKPSLTANADAQCRVTISVPTAGDAPGDYRVLVRGPSWAARGDGDTSASTSYTVIGATPTPTITPIPTNTSTPNCPFPSAAMLSTRITP